MMCERMIHRIRVTGVRESGTCAEGRHTQTAVSLSSLALVSRLAWLFFAVMCVRVIKVSLRPLVKQGRKGMHGRHHALFVAPPVH